jgi:hypothetical protein
MTTRQTAGAEPTRYPCLDSWGRYRAFPCGECEAPGCVFGRKPLSAAPQPREGERRCDFCRRPFRPEPGTRRRYCSEPCRLGAAFERRRRRREGGEWLPVYTSRG